MYGYHGCYLQIDVSTARAERRALDESVLRQFLGGSGLGVQLLLSAGAARFEPLAPEAVLALVFSPLVGSPLTTSAKFAVVCKSPLTDRINDSLASSHFAVAGKNTGHDALLLVGRAPVPSVVLVDDDQVRIEPAGSLWGLETRAAEAQLEARFGSGYQWATIGPAGERLVRYATISHDGRHAGRGGSGAVLGSKNIKALAVRGTRRCQWARPRELADLAAEISRKSLGPATAKYRELGTASNLLLFNRLAALPARNFRQGTLAGVEALAPERLRPARGKVRAYCAACTIGCTHIYPLGQGAAGDPAAAAAGQGAEAAAGVRLEYENLFALGPLCGVNDPDAVLRASARCDQLGLDTISAGGTIAFAMECAERGLLDAPWLRFGRGEAVLRALELVARREGLGDRLAAGSRRLARAIGHGTIAFAPQVKGLEMPGYEPRSLQTMALGLAVGTRGADHNRSGAYEVDFSQEVDRLNVGPAAARLAVETEDKAALLDALVLCRFLRGVFDDLFAEAAGMLNLVTGWDTTAAELRAAAQRIVTAKKRFNIEAGWTPAEDTLPARLLREPLPEEPRARLTPQRLAALVEAYNVARGWSPEGWIEP